MNDKKTDIISINEFYGNCLKETISINGKINTLRGPKGFVEIFEASPSGNQNKLVGRSNLVLYIGREWLAERIFGVDNPHTTSVHNSAVYWLGLGDAGTPLSDPFTPTAPTNLDTGLNNDIMINPTDSTNADYRLTPVPGYYKQPFDSVEFQQDIENNNAYIITKITITVGPDNANGYNLSEAGLFTAPSGGGGETGPFTCYARTTFPTVSKSSSRILTFIWWVYV